MTSVNEFKGEVREKVGKGAARALRRDGRVPAVVYGEGADPIHFSVDPVALDKALHSTGFFSKVFELDLGKNKEKALARQVQFHPVTDVPMHLDFVRVKKDGKIHVAIPLTFINEEKSPGMKKGGVLNISVHNLETNCPVNKIPETIEIDLEGMEIHDTVHLADLKLPEGVTPLHPERDDVIANIVAPTVMKGGADEAEEAEGEGEEGEGGEESSAE